MHEVEDIDAFGNYTFLSADFSGIRSSCVRVRLREVQSTEDPFRWARVTPLKWPAFSMHITYAGKQESAPAFVLRQLAAALRGKQLELKTSQTLESSGQLIPKLRPSRQHP